MGQLHHITVGEQSWCEWTGCQAGADIATKAGQHTCGHTSGRSAQRAAQALRPHFRRGAVKVVAGSCPVSSPRPV